MSDEETVLYGSEPVIPAPVPVQEVRAVNWICPGCKGRKNRTIVENGRVLVPLCQYCRTRNDRSIRCVEGVFEYTGEPVAKRVADRIPISPQDIRRGVIAREALKGEVFRALCGVLDANRVLSGAGMPMPNTCVKCTDTCVRGCPCACHPAWALRREVETKSEAA